jgi:hypothetical protein
MSPPPAARDERRESVELAFMRRCSTCPRAAARRSASARLDLAPSIRDRIQVESDILFRSEVCRGFP